MGKYQVKMFFLCGLCWTGDAMEIMVCIRVHAIVLAR